MTMGFPAAAQVPQPYADELLQRLAEAEHVDEMDFARAAGPFSGGLAPQQSRRYTITLRAGRDYRIFGVCDSRCSDIDLRLYDPSGAEIAEDTVSDSVPLLRVRPFVTGPHVVEVDMYRCSAAPCWYAFNVYSR